MSESVIIAPPSIYVSQSMLTSSKVAALLIVNWSVNVRLSLPLKSTPLVIFALAYERALFRLISSAASA